jgi:hypothetical protein
MTFAEANHLNRAITKCITLCRGSSDPYLELSNFISALRTGGVAEHYIQAINNAVLRDIASSRIVTNAGPAVAQPAEAGNSAAAHGPAVGATCYILK